ATPADRWKFDIVQSIRTLTLLKQAHPEKKLDGEFHFRPPATMQADFKEHPDLLANTIELAERCNFELPIGPPQFPAYKPPDGSTPKEFLRQLVLRGFHERYGNNPVWNSNAPFPLTPALSPREREAPDPAQEQAKRVGGSSNRKTILPLPWGEGEEDARHEP